MRNKQPSIAHGVLIGLAVLASAGHAQTAPPFPSKPVRLIVPYPAGTVPDILGRAFGAKLKESWGQPFIVESKPGATGSIGTEYVARSPGDGHTLLLNSNALLINPWISKQRFDVFKDLVPIIRTGQTAYVMTINPKLPIHNFSEFIDYAKKHPGKLACATYGIASPPHLALELLNREAGISIVHVPYSTSSPTPDVVSGAVDCSIAPPSGQGQFVKKGLIREIMHSGDYKMADYPLAEPVAKHYPGAVLMGWQAIFAPASTPAPLVKKLRADWRKAITDPSVVQTIKDNGFEPLVDDGDGFINAMHADHERFGTLTKSLGIRVD